MITSKMDEKLILMAAVFPNGTTRETYLFELDSKGKLILSVGTRNDREDHQIELLEVVNRAEKILTQAELVYCLNLINEIHNSPQITQKMFLTDSWEVLLWHDDINCHFDIHEYEQESPGLLIQKLIELAPFEVDIHGWA